MKRLSTMAWFAGLLLVVLTACNKDEIKLVATPNAAGVLQASESTVILTKENADAEAVQFQWDPADFGYPAALTNVLQFGIKGSAFEGAKEVTVTAGLQTRSYTTFELNSLLLSMGLPTEQASELEVRLKSSISEAVAPLYSNSIPLTVTPYASTSFVYVPGAHNGWDPVIAESLISPTSNGIYTGIINFPTVGSEFKITPQRSWDNAYGDGGDGKIDQNTQGNLKSPLSGNVELTVNTNTNTIVFKTHSWGIVGSAVGSWDNDIDMRYDNKTQIWKVTAELHTGLLKFRKNHDWGTNFGGVNNVLEAGGTDITVPIAGTYEITLDINTNSYALTQK
ncbi:SusE domain-containing protein [Sphingobacterium suaedae]|uniref:SusE domain-containing protein n=1 Tax=Sphingobacterium suaedae TaxID=1686402 RepID=A0ABW5KDP4_9SPHI